MPVESIGERTAFAIAAASTAKRVSKIGCVATNIDEARLSSSGSIQQEKAFSKLGECRSP
jgi:hypothetical protein